MNKVSRELSLKLTDDAIPKRCFYNAFLTWSGLKGGVYVEGVVLHKKTGFGPIEHGWLETAEGLTVDPTFAAEVEEWVYFPAFRYRSQREVMQIVGKRKRLPVYDARFGEGAINRSPEMKRAYAQAIIFCDENTPARISASLLQMADVMLREANRQ